MLLISLQAVDLLGVVALDALRGAVGGEDDDALIAAGQVLLPAVVSCVAAVQPVDGQSREVKTFHRQSAERESYHTARSTPSGSTCCISTGPRPSPGWPRPLVSWSATSATTSRFWPPRA